MGTFSAADIIGQNLVAKMPVKLYRYSNDLNNSIYTVKPGQTVGTVYSYLNSNNERPFLMWMFKDNNGRFYYAKHDSNALKLSAGNDVLSLEEKKEAAEAAAETTTDKIFKTVRNGALFAGLLYLGATWIKSNNAKN